MYSYDPQLILTKKQISFALLVLLHGGNLLFMIFEFIYVIDITQTTTTIHEAIYSIVGYVFIIIANFFMSQLLRGKGMFPYPVQKHFSLEINILLVLLFVCIILSLYYFVKGLFANKYSDQLMIEKVAQIYNISQLALWGWILIKIVKQTIEEDNDSTSIDCWVKLAQTTQVMDLVFNFIGHTKGSLMNNILQLGGRLLVAWVFIYPGVCFCSLRNAVLAWSLAELIRFSYYLFKDAPIIKTLRYNGFLVLYPFGITGEVRLVERYLEKNPDQLFLLRGIQAILLVGCAFLYLQMLRSRGKPAKIVETKGRASSPTSRHKRE